MREMTTAASAGGDCPQAPLTSSGADRRFTSASGTAFKTSSQWSRLPQPRRDSHFCQILDRPLLVVQYTRPSHFRGLSLAGLRRRTPGPPPFSSTRNPEISWLAVHLLAPAGGRTSSINLSFARLNGLTNLTLCKMNPSCRSSVSRHRTPARCAEAHSIASQNGNR